MSGVIVRRFAGRDFIIPTAASDIKTTPGAGAGASTTGRLIIVGVSEGSLGGAPASATDKVNSEKVIRFSSPSEAQVSLRGGEGLEAVLRAFNPSPDAAGPSEVSFLRVNSATKATADLNDAGSLPVITLSSLDYGIFNNRVNVAVATGTNEGKKITIILDDQTVQIDDVNLKSFSLTYTGDGSAATVTITNTTLTTSLTGQTDGSLNLSLAFATYKTIADLVAAINGATGGGYTAAVLTPDPTDLTTQLDNVAAVDIKSPAAPQLLSQNQAVIEAINAAGFVVSAVLKTAANRKPPANTSSPKFLTGGTEGSTTTTQWNDALNVLEGEDAQLLVAVTSDATVHASFASHCANMSVAGSNRERQCLVGAALAETVVGAKAAAKLINSRYASFVYPGIKFINVSGVATTFPGYIAAAAVAGLASGSPVQVPMTRKTVTSIGVEKVLTKSEREQLILSGVLPIESENGIIRVTRSITTYQTPNLMFAEFSILRTMLFITRDLRGSLDPLVSAPGDNTFRALAESITRSKLGSYRDQGLLIADPSDPIKHPAFSNLVFKTVEDQFFVEFDANVVAPVNFVFVTQRFSLLVQQS